MLRIATLLCAIAAFCLGSSATSADMGGARLQAKLKAAFAAGELAGLHSVLIMRGDAIFAEAHFPGDDQRWGERLGTRAHGADSLHDLRSVTKSVVGLLYGVALRDGLVPPLEAPLLDAFPEYADLAADADRRAILVRHALSMSMGAEWNEDLPYSDPRNSEIAMELASDRYRFVLDRPMVAEPGGRWIYNGGATAAIARLIERGAGMPLDAYAEKALFGPLGISDFDWVRGADGVPSAASGLRLNIHDLAKIGRLVLNRGRLGDAQIVPEDWIAAALAPHADVPSGLRYGYFWWLSPSGPGPVWAAGFGNGGQRLQLYPNSGMLIAVFAGNYNDPEAWRLPVKIILEFLVPTLEGR